MLASDGFMGCIGIMIVGDGGAIIGHYSNTETDIRQAEAKLPELISDNSAALSGARAYLYAQVKLRQPDDWVSEPNNLRLINIVNNNLDITPERVRYIEPEDMMVDDNDELLDECPEDLLYGAMMVKHTSQSTSTTFMDLSWQVSAAGWA
ncbi:hypothetical protein N7476_007266 [Penicillium atrosanguineum]|uniref:Uncharacterized protein n=1 Tax=Penicillium atrosanguineum TaxID=1132637 RepID=A0A9W9PU00_9EURO|nr:hypothetical protein N7526_006813 [Penicillium atrosanguineum]KAJ5311406.1 hypothetical protein N7476_007266 [Penicillium atrosanguineum]